MIIKAVIVCNGSIRDYEYHQRYLTGTDLLICVDGGARHAENLGVIPDILMGDFDSISQEAYNNLVNKGVQLYRFPPEKDMTDSELAVELALEKGVSEVILLGCIGTRMDHSLANMALLKLLLDKGVTGVIADEYNEIRLIKDKIELVSDEDCRVSLLPYTTEVSGITTEGLYYPLKDAVIKLGSSRGVSNEFIGSRAAVTIKEGLLLVIKSRD